MIRVKPSKKASTLTTCNPKQWTHMTHIILIHFICDSICNYYISKSTCHILPAAKNIYLPPMYALIFKMVSLITLMLHYSWTEIATKQQAVLQKLLPRPQLQTRPTEIWEIKERLLLPWKCSRLARSRIIEPCCWNINLLEGNISIISQRNNHQAKVFHHRCFIQQFEHSRK